MQQGSRNECGFYDAYHMIWKWMWVLCCILIMWLPLLLARTCGMTRKIVRAWRRSSSWLLEKRLPLLAGGCHKRQRWLPLSFLNWVLSCNVGFMWFMYSLLWKDTIVCHTWWLFLMYPLWHMNGDMWFMQLSSILCVCNFKMAAKSWLCSRMQPETEMALQWSTIQSPSPLILARWRRLEAQAVTFENSKWRVLSYTRHLWAQHRWQSFCYAHHLY